jgi:hypothetical protein
MSNASAVEAVLFAALKLESPAERDAYLDSACGGDAELRRQVDRLLLAHIHVGDFLQKPAVERLAAASESAEDTRALDASTDGPDAEPSALAPLFLPPPEGGEVSEEGDSFDFLEPPSRGGSLGRLGHYEVLEVLGQGGFGIVFRAFDQTLQRVVAIKVLAPELAATSPPRKRFLREARSSAKVRHEHVVQVYAVEEEPLPHLVMEFVPGETLQQRIDRTGPLETAEVVHFGRQIAEGLAAAHARGLVHRDIKPANVLIEAGANPSVKLTDFGLARTADDASMTQSGVVAGTPMYMAPEQAQGEALDHRADLFSLGSVLYTMAAGRPPFRASNTLAVLKRVAEDAPRPIPEIIPEVPQWLCDLIARLHAKKPEDRIGTAREVADLLGRGLVALQRATGFPPLPAAGPAAVAEAPRDDRAPAGAVKLPQPAPAVKPPSRGRFWAVAAAVFLALLGGLGFTEATGVTHVRGTVIRVFSPSGTLVVEVDDPDVSVTIDGEDLVITGAGAKEVRLKPRSYAVEARKDGKIVSRELVSVTKNGRKVVQVSQKARPIDPDRRAAEYVLSLGGMVKVNGRDLEIRAAAELPRASFQLTEIWCEKDGWVMHGRGMVDDAGLAYFKDCKNLSCLWLHGCLRISDAGLAHIKDCKTLTQLSLWQAQVSDAGLARLKEFKGLTRLDLAQTRVTNAGLAHFKGCNNLTHLSLYDTRVSDTGLAHLRGTTNLAQLNLARTQLSNAGLAYFKDCKKLEMLCVAFTRVGDAGLAHFKDCKKLNRLDVRGCPEVSDASLTHFKDCVSLTSLDARGTRVTAAVIAELKKALPKCRIEWDGGVIQPK